MVEQFLVLHLCHCVALTLCWLCQYVNRVTIRGVAAACGTFHDFTGRAPPGYRIDYVFAGPRNDVPVVVEAVTVDTNLYPTRKASSAAAPSSSTDMVLPSDHFPVFVQLAWRA